MKASTLLALTLAVSVSGAANAGDGAKLFAENTCTACHGKVGNKPLMSDYPKIAGQNKAYSVKQMTDIKSGKRANGNAAAMQGVMVLVNEQEIQDIAEFVSKLKP